MITHRCRQGFSLIEVMIALGLGTVIIYTALAGFRVASQAVTTASKLSLENSCFRAGFTAANDAVDFWTDVDDPHDATKQLLRQWEGQASSFGLYGTQPAAGPPLGPDQHPLRALPFTPFTLSFPRGAVRADGLPESQVGWTPYDTTASPWVDNWAMTATNKLAWYRGDPRVGCNFDERFGHYGIFGNCDPIVNLAGPTGNYFDGQAGWANVGSNFGYGTAIPVKNNWCNNQFRGLYYGLGWYGMAEYLPPNIWYQWYTSFKDRSAIPNEGDNNAEYKIPIPRRLRMQATGVPYHTIVKASYSGWNSSSMFWNNFDWDSHCGRDLFGITHLGAFIMPTPYGPDGVTPWPLGNTSTWDINNERSDDLLNNAYRAPVWGYNMTSPNGNVANGGNSGDSQNLKAFNIHVPTTSQLLPALSKPDAWPSLTVSVQRYISNARRYSLCSISLTNPVTGQNMRLPFSSFGTTLRGARQQRRPGAAGWAKWDNAATVNGHLESTDKTLDDY